MQHLDLQVIRQALDWARQGNTVWLCTVLSTFGSSPREPGSMMVANACGQHVGSLSGGCVEEDFLQQLQLGGWRQPVQTVSYGAANDPLVVNARNITLPCGGILEVLVECLPASDAVIDHLARLEQALQGQFSLRRLIRLDADLQNQKHHFELIDSDATGERVLRSQQQLSLLVGPGARLIIAGISTVSVICAQFARTLGFEVIVCDPREEARAGYAVEGTRLEAVMPSRFIQQSGHCHRATAVVAMTHDPRIDDLAMMEAVKTEAFYIGVMGSRKTSDARASRLLRSGGLTVEQVERIHMPIGLALGSKTPAEIALAVMADIVRVQKGRARDQL